LYSQAARVNLPNDLQSKIEKFKTAWIESLTWADKKNSNSFNRIKISAKILTKDHRQINKALEDFVSSLGEINAAEQVENIQMAFQNGRILPFSFDLILRQQSEIFIK
jgi:hypothetical protein